MAKSTRCPNCGNKIELPEDKEVVTCSCGKSYANPYYTGPKTQDAPKQDTKEEAKAEAPKQEESVSTTTPGYTGSYMPYYDDDYYASSGSIKSNNTPKQDEVKAEPTEPQVQFETKTEPKEEVKAEKVKEKKVKAEKEEKPVVEKKLEEKPAFEPTPVYSAPLPKYTPVAESAPVAPAQPVAVSKVSNTKSSDILFDVIKSCIKEFFKFEQYKRFPVALAVFAGIVLSPLLIGAILLIPYFYILNFITKAISAPADYLLQQIRNEGDTNGVKIVVYLVGYPTVFAYKSLLAFFSLFYFFAFFWFNVCAYLYGCGGIKFQPFIFDASTDCSAHLPEGQAPFGLRLTVLLVCIGIVLAIILGVAIPSADDAKSNKTQTIEMGTLTLNNAKSVPVESKNGVAKGTFNVSASTQYSITISNSTYSTLQVYIDGRYQKTINNYLSSDTITFMADSSGYKTIEIKWTDAEYKGAIAVVIIQNYYYNFY